MDLISACEFGDEKRIYETLNDGSNPNGPTSPDGVTALHFMCKYNKLELVKNFLEVYKCNPEVKDRNGRTPLHYACHYGSTLIVKYLAIDKRCVVTVKDKYQRTPLHYACKHGHETIVSTIVEKYIDINVGDINEWTPLHHACAYGHINIVKFLATVQHCKFDCLDTNGLTPLHHACRQGNIHVAEYLIEEQGCSLVIKDKSGLTPLKLLKLSSACELYINCCKHGRLKLLKVLLLHNSLEKFMHHSDCYPLHVACQYGQLSIMNYHIDEQGCNPNEKDKYHRTPLHYAAQNGHEDIVQLLSLTYGCNVDIEDKDQRNSLHYASMNGHTDIVRLLGLKLSCSSGKDKDQRSSLHYASMNGHTDTVRVLCLELECNPNIEDRDQRSPLHHACMNDHISVVQVLGIELGCNPNTQDKDQRTPLHYACMNGCTNIVQVLGLQLGCDPNVRDKNLRTPLHYACEKGYTDVVRVLGVKLRCNPNVKDINQNTPIDLVCQLDICRVDLIECLVTEVGCKIEDTSISYNLLNFVGDPEIVEIAASSLIHAFKGRKLEVVRAFANNSKVQNVLREEHYTTVTHLACEYVDESILEYVLTIPRLDFDDADENNAVLFMFNQGSLKLLKLLVEVQRLDPLKLLKKMCARGHCSNYILMMEYLLFECGISPKDSAEVICCIALHGACDHGNIEIIKYLINTYNCNPLGRNKYGLTSLHIACQQGYTDIVKFFIHDPAFTPYMPSNIQDIKDTSGNTLLHLACKNNKYSTVSYLLRTLKFNPNIVNSAERFPIQLTNHSNIIGDLIKCGSEFTSTDVSRWMKSSLIKTVGTAINDPNKKTVDGNCMLHVAVKLSKHRTVEYLLSELTCDPNAVNDAGETPLAIATNATIIRQLIQHGAKATTLYKSYGSSLGTKKPLKPSVKLFVLGNPSVGKSTLVAALKKEVSFLGRLFSVDTVTGVDKCTAGIIPHEFKSKKYGRVSFYDFAGQRQFYSSHAALLQNAIQSHSSIFLIVINLCDSDQEIHKTIHYWYSFLENQSTSADNKSDVLIIGSHEDLLKAQGKDPKERTQILESLLESLPKSENFNKIAVVTMDCRYSESPGINELRRHLTKLCKTARILEQVSFNSHCFYIYLLDNFLDLEAVSLCTVQKKIQEHRTAFESEEEVLKFLPEHLIHLQNICTELNDRGHILFLKDKSIIENSWVVINQEALLSEVTGTIFAPKGFKQYRQIASNTGVVPLSKLSEHFPKYNTELIVGFLSHLEFCHEIKDSEVLQLVNEHTQSATQLSFPDRCFLFPALITLATSENVWKHRKCFKFYSGWSLQCVRQNQFFTSRFLQVLLLRLAFSFVLKTVSNEIDEQVPGIHRECSIWKNGIFWGNTFGCEAFVEMTPDNKTVIFLLRCQDSCSLRAIGLRTQVIQTIKKCIQDFCSRVKVVESFIDPSDVQEFPTKQCSTSPQFTLGNIAKALVHSDKGYATVVSKSQITQLDHLLVFEPYAEVTQYGILVLSNEQTLNHSISEQFVKKLYKQESTKLEQFMEIFKSENTKGEESAESLIQATLNWRDDSERTYRCLRTKLDQFSVFAGENILVTLQLK